MLPPQVPDGFISHFYSVSEHVSPVLAFGFLGPKPQLAEVCAFFKVSRVLRHCSCLGLPVPAPGMGALEGSRSAERAGPLRKKASGHPESMLPFH